MLGDTIVAQASPPGAAERAILRVSGPAAQAILRQLCLDPELCCPRGARSLRLFDGEGWVSCLCLCFEAPRSYTGEDTLEIHMPGALPLVQAMLERIQQCGARAAEPGEFTRRAFLHGRIDLSRAEGVLALIEARTEEERRAALEWLGGGLEREVHAIGAALLDLRALCEAALDFDESDTAAVRAQELAPLYADLRARMARAKAQESERSVRGERGRVVLAGAPSAGKSSLFNALLGAERALVDPAPGTTRDAMREDWQLDRHALLLCDLAGLSEFPADELDALAQARARELVAEADLVLWIARADAPELARRPAGSLLVWSQIDRPQAQPAPSGAIAVSVPTGAGLAALRAAIAHEWQSQGGGLLGALRARHAAAWQRAADHLERSWFLLQSAAALELCAEELRLAQTEVEKISGESGVEDVLDRIFARFCLGK
jgi:tRNA modification GTPase